MTEIDRGDLVDAAVSLLHAAILLRDFAGAIPPRMAMTMPPDLHGRLFHHRYQGAFDRLPEDVKAEAQAIVERDPEVVAARAIDSGSPKL